MIQYPFSKALEEKLPQAFMQIEWIPNDFRNLTAQVWANLDNPIKSYDFSTVLINFLYATLLGSTLLQSVMSQLEQLFTGTVDKIQNI